MNNYYVYIHKDQLGNVFYVGSGTKYRYTSKQNRSKLWHEKTMNGFNAEKVCEGLTLELSRELEDLTIKMIGIENLINTQYPSEAIEITTEMLSWFKYDCESPSGIVWAKGNKIGKVAGKQESRKNQPHRWRVHVPGSTTSLAVHRIVWSMHHNLLRGYVVDHIDGNPWNNKLDNLRAVDLKTNSRNMKKRSTNNSGVTGVYFKKNVSGHTFWTASWREDDSRNRSKSFMIEKYGYDEAFNLACNFRATKIEELKAKGFEYTDRHIA